jgi:hypothetical protein
MMNILPRNISDVPCVFQDMIHRMGLLFWQLWYMINRKPPSWMTQVTWLTLVDCLRAGLFGPKTIYSCDQVTCIIHSGGFLIICNVLGLHDVTSCNGLNKHCALYFVNIIICRPVNMREAMVTSWYIDINVSWFYPMGFGSGVVI